MKRPRYLGPGAPVFFVEDDAPPRRRRGWIVGGILSGLLVIGTFAVAWVHESPRSIG